MIRAFSAPGKCMFVGGYLVLDRKYDSFVIALSSRMHSVISEKTILNNSQITITSHQFNNEKWIYNFKLENGICHIYQIFGLLNPYIDATIKTILYYIQPKNKFNLDIKIYSDPEFHSKENSIKKHSKNGKKSFLFFDRNIDKVCKTGLGSSACLISVVSAALLEYFKPGILNQKNIIHNVAQISHSFAQKKIGSGFDICASIYGTIIYKKFSFNFIEEIMDVDILSKTKSWEKDSHLSNKLRQVIESEWDQCINKIHLPPFISLLIGDVNCGSNTLVLVSDFFNWKKNNELACDQILSELNDAKNDFVDKIEKLSKFYDEFPNRYLNYMKIFKNNNMVHKDQNNSLKNESQDLKIFYDFRLSILKIRDILYKMTQKIKIDIMPLKQKKLLDYCSVFTGCFGGVVPGAGGNDAVCLLLSSDSIEDFINTFDTNNTDNDVTWIRVNEDNDGLRQEDYHDYEFLLS